MANEDELSGGMLGEAIHNPEAIKQMDESLQTYQEMEHSSDRICAIVSAAMIEGRLRRALSWRLGPPGAFQKRYSD